MSETGGRAWSLRRRLFVSHLVVMVVALMVLALVVGIVGAIGEKRAFGPRDDGGPQVLLVGVTAAVVASALVSWRITRRLARPMDDIGAAARDLARGRYTARVPNTGTAELDALADDVNTLAVELETTEQRRLRLIGDVAHELRNPLSTIEGTMEALLDGVVPADDDTYTRVGREASRLRRLADDLSSLSAAGELGQIVTEPVDVATIAAHVVAQLEPQAAAKGLALSLDASPSPLLGDRDRLTQVVMNVVGNAVQYTDQGGVAVRVAGGGGAVTVTVTDTGRGLAADDQVRVFDRFHRVDEHFADGTGVGLAIARMIVEAHRGTIGARSAGAGLGTTITIDLPVSADT